MKKLIQLTSAQGGPVYVNPDYIVMVSSVGRDPQSSALITLVAPILPGGGMDGYQGLRVQESLQQVMEMIGPPPDVDTMGAR
jgi:hypothetical protein